jgi:outer membrane protein OmpA-like peptidoglycan-associated protein
MLKKIYLIVTVLLLSQAALFAQTTRNAGSLKMARKQYESLRYTPAIEILVNFLRDHPGDLEAEEMLANSYRNINDYKQALYWYGELTKAATVKPEWALYYAQALANKQQYKESELWYNKYVELVTKDNKAGNAKDGMAASFAKAYGHVDDFLKNRADWRIAYLNINTAGAEYSPMYYKKGLLFVSNRRTKGITKNVFEWDQTPFSDLYYMDNLSAVKEIDPDSVMEVLRKEIKASGKKLYKENDDDTGPTSNDSKIVGSYDVKILRDTLGDFLSSKINFHPLQGDINSKYHEGPAALLPDQSIMFTRNNYVDKKYGTSKDGINKLKIYTAIAPDFTNIIPFPYNNDQYSVGHPALNSTGTLLIFTSDMPGGYGGTDLYYSKRTDTRSQWSKPVNMGPVINTSGNEMFPTIYKDSTLLFSSTGHPGLGGLDIFQVALNDVTPLHAPVNLGAPINSSVDDFGMIKSNDGKSGYFSSNRKGSDDIYSFKNFNIHINLNVLVVDSLTGHIITGSKVIVADNSHDTPDGKYSTTLTRGTDYKIAAAKEGYTNCVSTVVHTDDYTSDIDLTVSVKLCKIPPTPVIAKVEPLTCDSVKIIFDVRKIYYDLDKSDIRPDAHVELANLMSVLNTYPQLKVILASHCDSRASSKYNDALSMRRSQSARAYLLAHGVPASKIKMEYYGKSRLANACADGVNCSEAEQQLNRRTEFILINNGVELQTVNCDKLKKLVK